MPDTLADTIDRVSMRNLAAFLVALRRSNNAEFRMLNAEVKC